MRVAIVLTLRLRVNGRMSGLSAGIRLNRNQMKSSGETARMTWKGGELAGVISVFREEKGNLMEGVRVFFILQLYPIVNVFPRRVKASVFYYTYLKV